MADPREMIGAVIILALSFVGLFLSWGSALFTTVVFAMYILVLWSGTGSILKSRAGPGEEWIASAAADSLFFLISWLTYFLVSGFSLVPGTSPTPHAFLFLISVGMFLLTIWRFFQPFEDDLGGGIYLYWPFMIVIVVFVLFQGGLIGGELEQMFGPASGVVGAGIDTVEGGYNTVVDSLEDNRQFARMQCMWELGGPVGAAFVPATKLSQCVRKRMGAGNRTNATSAQVTQPVEVRVGDIEVAPFSDHVTVRAPVTNTLVYDTRGVPIDEIPARNVDVTVAWIYGGETVRKKKVSLGEVPNGATKLAGDNEDLSFDWVPVISKMSDNQIKSYLRQWASNKIKPSKLESELDKVQKARVLLIAESLSDIKMKGVANAISYTDSNDKTDRIEFPLVAGPDYEYRVGVRVSYDYSAEAAFTESSRWSSGNQLLEVWRESAWQELSLQEREAWKNRKCGTITKVGQKFERQRTAALTTPVVPVMYTYCGIQLFDNFGKDGKKGKVPITIGVTVNSENLDTDKGFTVKKVASNCFSQKMENLQGGFVGSEWVKGDQGWVPEKGSLTLQKNRKDVKIKGERKSIACRTRMNLRINVLKWYGRYTIPVIGR